MKVNSVQGEAKNWIDYTDNGDRTKVNVHMCLHAIESGYLVLPSQDVEKKVIEFLTSMNGRIKRCVYEENIKKKEICAVYQMRKQTLDKTLKNLRDQTQLARKEKAMLVKMYGRRRVLFKN